MVSETKDSSKQKKIVEALVCFNEIDLEKAIEECFQDSVLR